jgi:hypothetical protein
VLGEALIHLREQPPPASHWIPGLLDGLTNINATVALWRNGGSEFRRAAV